MSVRHCGWVACGLLLVSAAAWGQATSAPLPGGTSLGETNGTPLIQILDTVAKKTGKKFVVEPHIGGNVVLVGLDASKVTYPELLTILQVQGLAAIESGGLVRIIPNDLSRAQAVPLISANEKRADAEYVTRVISVKSVVATQLVPILRSLLPQNAHLAALHCTNELIMVDTYANVRRLEAVIAAMDRGAGITLPVCGAKEP